MKKLVLGFALVIGMIGNAQKITINVFEAEYLGNTGKYNYTDVIQNPDVRMGDANGINAKYSINLNTNKITYTTNNNTQTKSITSVINQTKYNLIIKFNDTANDGTNRIIPVIIELNLTPGLETMILSWYNVDKNRTMVQVNKTATYSIKL
jgi:hypothetical protein